jgi:hypothetical protein
MTTRRSSDDTAATVYDGDRAAAAAHETFELDATEVNRQVAHTAVEQGTPTHVDPPWLDPAAPALIARAERSEPIRAISMRDQVDAQNRRPNEQHDPHNPRVPLHVQLRSIAEASGRHREVRNLGHLAPPRDPRQARARHRRGNLLWACAALALAGSIALAIWLVAGR